MLIPGRAEGPCSEAACGTYGSGTSLPSLHVVDEWILRSEERSDERVGYMSRRHGGVGGRWRNRRFPESKLRSSRGTRLLRSLAEGNGGACSSTTSPSEARSRRLEREGGTTDRVESRRGPERISAPCEARSTRRTSVEGACSRPVAKQPWQLVALWGSGILPRTQYCLEEWSVEGDKLACRLRHDTTRDSTVHNTPREARQKHNRNLQSSQNTAFKGQ